MKKALKQFGWVIGYYANAEKSTQARSEIHALLLGYPLCGFEAEQEDEFLFVAYNTRQHVECERCLHILKENAGA